MNLPPALRSSCWSVLLLTAACSRNAPDPPPPAARYDIAQAPPGALGAHPASASARPAPLEVPPGTSPHGHEPDDDDESSEGGGEPPPPTAPSKPDGVAL